MPGAGETLIPQMKYRSLSRLAPEKASAAVDLVYVTDARPGITRIRKGRQFCYIYNKSAIRDKKVLQRIKSLVLPPAWENVWICTLHNGHLQATGTDTRQRKQYKYHPQWIALDRQLFFHLNGHCFQGIQILLYVQGRVFLLGNIKSGFTQINLLIGLMNLLIESLPC